MSYPAERHRRHSRYSGRPLRVSRRREVSDGIFRDPLLAPGQQQAIRRVGSPRGHVELTDFGDPRGSYQPPALHDSLPVVEGLAVEHGSGPTRTATTRNPSPSSYRTSSNGTAALANANPAKDLSIPYASHGCFCIQCVRTQEVGIIENFGDFQEVVGPGLYFLLPWSCISKRLSLRIQQLDVDCEVNTSDKVFCSLHLSILFRVSVMHAYEACYHLQDPLGTIESLVLDVLRSTVPGIELDVLFQSRDEIVDAVSGKLRRPLCDYGYELCSVLLTRIEPEASVRNALNEAPAATRWKEAAAHQAEAVRIERVKQAEAAAERSYLHGIGTARQREALAVGLRDSTQAWMDDVYVQGPTHGQIMELLLVTQYFDVLMDIGAQHVVMPIG